MLLGFLWDVGLKVWLLLASSTSVVSSSTTISPIAFVSSASFAGVGATSPSASFPLPPLGVLTSSSYT